MRFPFRWSFCSLVLPAMAAGLLSSCQTMEHEGSTVAIPKRWQQESSQTKPLDTTSLGQWWHRFNDPVLTRVVETSLQSSPDLRTAHLRMEAAQAQVGMERSSLFPQITGSTSGRGLRQNHEITGSSGSEAYGAGFNTSWEVDLFGKNQQRVRASQSDLVKAEEDYYGSQVSLAASVAEAYVRLRAAQAQLAVFQSNLKAREETTQITRWREQAGEGTTLETRQATSTLDQVRAALPSLRQTVDQTRNQITLLAGKTPGSLDSLLADSRGIPSAPRKIATGIPAETLRFRPDVRAAERGIEAAIARRRAAELERYPSFTLSGSLGVDATNAGRLFHPELAAASIAGNLTAPIFNAGRIRETIHFQNVQEKQAVVAYEATVLNALTEVENALIAVRQTAERLRTLNSAVASASEAATLADQSFNAGEVDLIQVLEAQRNLLSLQEQQVSTRSEHSIAIIQLYRALGGGWTPLP